jgi:hypothetical protein
MFTNYSPLEVPPAPLQWQPDRLAKIKVEA